MYQDRTWQTVVRNSYIESQGCIKMYDTMRQAYVIINGSNGYIVSLVESPSNRSYTSFVRPNVPPPARRIEQSSAVAQVASAALAYPSTTTVGGITIYSTDKVISNDTSLPDATWTTYFDTTARRHFYLRNQGGSATVQYDHPSPPIFGAGDQVLTDEILTDASTLQNIVSATSGAAVNILPFGWLKLQSVSKGLPYYIHLNSSETRWVHPNPPPSPSRLTAVSDINLNSALYTKYIDPTTGQPFYIKTATLEGQWDFPSDGYNAGPSAALRASSAVAQQASSALIQLTSGANASSATAQAASSALAESISGAQASSAVAQTVSSALAQAISGAQASSALGQTVSSALAQAISGAQASSATAQQESSALAQSISGAQASSAFAQSISGAQASSATAQEASSALAQSISGAQASSALAQSISGAQASSALAQSISGALAQGIALGQGASSALAQSISGAQASSATAQQASSALVQSVSGALASSATAQQASSALAQSISGANASSATAQSASSALAQSISGAQASSAQLQDSLAKYISQKDRIKNDITGLKAYINTLIGGVYSRSSVATVSDITDLRDNIAILVSSYNQIQETAQNIFQIQNYYQDTALQTILPNTKLTPLGLKMVFDTLRNKYIVLDSRGNITTNPVTPVTRGYTTFVMRGGKRKSRKAKKV
jgi:hypothetical protein